MLELLQIVQLHLRENHLMEITDYQLGEWVGVMRFKLKEQGYDIDKDFTPENILYGLVLDIGIRRLKLWTEKDDDLLKEVRQTMR